MTGQSCGARIEVEVDDFDPHPSDSWALVCTMNGPHETHRAVLFWSPTEEEYRAMEAADKEEESRGD